MTTTQIESVKYNYKIAKRAKEVLNSLILLIEEEHSKILNTKTLKTFETFLIRNIEDINLTKTKMYGYKYHCYNILSDRTVVCKFKILRDSERLFTEDTLYFLNEELRKKWMNQDYIVSEFERKYSEILES